MQNKKYLEMSVTGYFKKAKTISRPLMLKSRTMYIYVCGIEQNKRFKKNFQAYTSKVEVKDKLKVT